MKGWRSKGKECGVMVTSEKETPRRSQVRMGMRNEVVMGLRLVDGRVGRIADFASLLEVRNWVSPLVTANICRRQGRALL